MPDEVPASVDQVAHTLALLSSAPELNQVFLAVGPGFRFREATSSVLGPAPDLARVIKARDLDDDGLTDIIVGTTYPG